jgi:hypothetical protein
MHAAQHLDQIEADAAVLMPAAVSARGAAWDKSDANLCDLDPAATR